MKPLRVGIITVSDRVSAGLAEDLSGPRLQTLLESGELFPAVVEKLTVVPDEKVAIQAAVTSLCQLCDVLLTTGGTGLAPRDVTPEAVAPLLDRAAPGLVAAMLYGSLAITPLAMLSRPVAGVLGCCVVATLPGSPKGAGENLRLLSPGLPHAVDLVQQRLPHVQSTHQLLQAAAGPAGHEETGSAEHKGTESAEHKGTESAGHTGTESAENKGTESAEHKGTESAGHEGTESAEHKGTESAEHKGTESAEHQKTGPASKAVGHHCQHKCESNKTISLVDLSQVAHRTRQSPYVAISLEEAQQCELQAVESYRRTVHTVNVAEARGLVLAEDVRAVVPLPPFPASVKDGYAVVASDGAGARRVLGAANAGQPFQAATHAVGTGQVETVEVVSGTCARISTGAPVPAGADAVVMVENTRLLECSEDGKQELSVIILEKPLAGQEIRPQGSDIAAGTLVLKRGQRLGPFELATLVTVGFHRVLAFDRPRVAVMSTGCEVQEPGGELAEGRIYDTNRTTLLAMLPDSGADVRDAGIVADDPSELLTAVRTALQWADVLVTTGGVSMGERDIIKHVLTRDLGADVKFGRVFMKPGMPTTFATLVLYGRPKFVFGLPGNPVSAAVCSVLHVMPTLRKMAGRSDFQNKTVRVCMDKPRKLDRRPEFVRATLAGVSVVRGRGVSVATATGDQMSSNVLSLRGASVLVPLPAYTKEKPHCDDTEGVDAIVMFGDI